MLLIEQNLQLAAGLHRCICEVHTSGLQVSTHVFLYSDLSRKEGQSHVSTEFRMLNPGVS